MVRVINPMDDAVPPVFDGFPEAGLSFLRKLKRNNNREWFNDHKDEYLGNLKEPMETLLAALALKMHERLPDMNVEIDPKKSVYRIYRDIRFSKDKTPYKTHVGASFTVAGRNRKYDPGYYFHIAPKEIIIAGGAYSPPPDQLKSIRRAIDTDYETLEAILTEKKFVRHYEGLSGDSLTRLPREYQKGHPAEEWLKMKSFYCWAELKPELATGEDFDDILMEYLDAMSPLVAWLLKAIV